MTDGFVLQKCAWRVIIMTSRFFLFDKKQLLANLLLDYHLPCVLLVYINCKSVWVWNEDSDTCHARFVWALMSVMHAVASQIFSKLLDAYSAWQMPSPRSKNCIPLFGTHAIQIFLESKRSITSCILPDPDIFTFDILWKRTAPPSPSKWVRRPGAQQQEQQQRTRSRFF